MPAGTLPGVSSSFIPGVLPTFGRPPVGISRFPREEGEEGPPIVPVAPSDEGDGGGVDWKKWSRWAGIPVWPLPKGANPDDYEYFADQMKELDRATGDTYYVPVYKWRKIKAEDIAYRRSETGLNLAQIQNYLKTATPEELANLSAKTGLTLAQLASLQTQTAALETPEEAKNRRAAELESTRTGTAANKAALAAASAAATKANQEAGWFVAPGGKWRFPVIRDRNTGNIVTVLGQAERVPLEKKYKEGRETRITGRTDPYGNQQVQDYEINTETGVAEPVGAPYFRPTEAPAPGIGAYRGIGGAPLSAMEVEKMRAASEGVIGTGASPSDFLALLAGQRAELSAGAGLASASDKYLPNMVSNVSQAWPSYSLPQQADVMDRLKGIISMPGQPAYIPYGWQFGGQGQLPAPGLPEELFKKKTTWPTLAPRWRG